MCFNGLPWWLSGKESPCQCRRHEFNPWVLKIPWKRKWQPTPVLLPGKFHKQRSLVSYSPWGCKESDPTGHTNICICFKRRNWLHRYGRTGKHQSNLVVVIAGSDSFTWGYKGRRLEFPEPRRAEERSCGADA